MAKQVTEHSSIVDDEYMDLSANCEEAIWLRISKEPTTSFVSPSTKLYNNNVFSKSHGVKSHSNITFKKRD